MSLEKHIVAVTGGFGSLGHATVARLRTLGARVAVIDVGPRPDGAGDDDSSLILDAVDLTDADAARQVFARIATHFGGLDGLVNIAGGYRWQPVAGSEPALWEQLHAINLRTCLHATLGALPHLAEGGGAIVNIGALGAIKAGNGNGPYAASKAAVHKLTEALADEQKSRGVRVNAVLPSIIDTPANRQDMPDADFTQWARPEEVAEVIAFLLSPQASGVTGALVPVAGRV